MEKKQVWLNINTGEFSNSWDASEPLNRTEENLKESGKDGWKLIEFTCLNDETFVFTQHMKLR
jgi:hypothetical protein